MFTIWPFGIFVTAPALATLDVAFAYAPEALLFEAAPEALDAFEPRPEADGEYEPSRPAAAFDVLRYASAIGEMCFA